jgi:hypothetical protein
VNVLFSRPEKIEEIQAHVFASFANAQKDKVVADAFFRSDSVDDLPERSEGFDGVLSVVIVPRYAIEVQKCKELVAIPLQPFLDLDCYFALQGYVRDLPIESIDSRQMLPQKAALEAISINGFHHWLEQDRKGQCEPLQFFVVGVLQHVVV